MIAAEPAGASSARERHGEKTIRVAERLRHFEMVVSLADYQLDRLARRFHRRSYFPQPRLRLCNLCGQSGLHLSSRRGEAQRASARRGDIEGSLGAANRHDQLRETEKMILGA